MIKHISKQLFVNVAVVLFVSVLLIAFLNVITNPSLFLTSTSLQLPVGYHVKVLLLFVLIYSLEYLPVFLLIAFMLSGYLFKTNRVFLFSELKGFAAKKYVLWLAFAFALVLSIVSSWFINTSLPKLIQNFLKEQKVSLISELIQKELPHIAPQRLTTLDKYGIYANTITQAGDTVNFHKAVIFEKDVLHKKDSKVTAILYCKNIELNATHITVHNCFRQALINTAYFTSIPYRVYSLQEIQNLLDKSLDYDYKESSPEFLQYYIHTTQELITLAQDPQCPKNTYPMIIRRALFALAFITYSLLGLFVVLYMQIGLVSLLAFLIMFAAVLPTLGNYLLLLDKYGFAFFSATYLLPLVGSVLFFLYWLAIKYGGNIYGNIIKVAEHSKKVS